jgi:ribose transport system ATP-binding protein
LLVLDEPTARLPHDSVEDFFARIRTIAGQGNAVLFVSHRLDEVVALADRVTVLRDGRVSERLEQRDLTVARLVTAMLGAALPDVPPERDLAPADVVIRITGLSGGPVERFDMDLHRGEILGLTGLLGMGHDSIPYLLFGAADADAGTIAVADQVLDASALTPRTALGLGVALLPGNRARDASVGEATVRENMTLATLASYFRGGWLRHSDETRSVLAQMDSFKVTPRDPDAPMSTLSGGNQQKALLAKWLAAPPRVLLLDEPTHGVDIGAKRQIYRLLADAASSGMAILVSSVETTDLADHCHRVLVMRRGRIVSELTGAGLTADRIAAEVQYDRAPSEPSTAVRR